MHKILINGIASEYLPATDRGLHYGDGIFETIACEDSHPVFVHQHLQRMENAAGKLDIPFPGRHRLQQDIGRLLAGNEGKCVIKVILTRGSGKRGYRYDRGQAATRISMRSSWPHHVTEWQQHGIIVRFCETPVSLNPALAGIKSLNRLENVIASSELGTAHDEGFMSDIDGHVIEGTMSNLFAVIEGALVTPDLSRGGIKGIIREQILDIAKNSNIKHEIRDIGRDELLSSGEIFICNSVTGICRVKQLEQQHYAQARMTATIKTQLQQRIKADAKAAA
ncbi:MAG: aminodeoxychorismate lyase [Gammaproteobacteria bacterium]|nr:aminodeoxychorismate lyase [Gammaproteobacteria bacterium]NNL06176.1 aminodeoxychorismate lyase [Gammaproteobacteria bacterium]